MGKKRWYSNSNNGLIYLKKSEQTPNQKANNGGSNLFKPQHLSNEQRAKKHVPMRRSR